MSEAREAFNAAIKEVYEAFGIEKYAAQHSQQTCV